MTVLMPAGVALARTWSGPAMESAIARLTPDVRKVATYHLGFADAAGNPTANGSGKALRPGLVVAAGGKEWAEADAQLAAANASLADIDLADVPAELTAIAKFITVRT